MRMFLIPNAIFTDVKVVEIESSRIYRLDFYWWQQSPKGEKKICDDLKDQVYR